MTIRKVDLNMKAEEKYLAIKKLVETDANKQRTAINLGCTLRHVNRMIQGYNKEGKAFFVHGNKGKKPIHSLNNEIKDMILDLYRTKYWDANFTHFSELLAKHEGINVSPSTVNSILMQEYILSPKARRLTKKRIKNQLKEQKKSNISKKESDKIMEQLLDLEDAHQRRPRCVYTGEVIQMGGSVHDWFGGIKTQLHIAVDDATGSIVAAYFDTQETLNAYYNVLNQILKNYGIPYMFLTDRRTVFEYKQKNPLQWKRTLSLNSAMHASN